MSQLLDLLEKVRDENLGLDMLEKYRDQLIHLHSMMQIELSDVEKAEAITLASATEEETDAARKRKWRATEKGLRQIELNRYIKATLKECDSLKNRIFAAIR